MTSWVTRHAEALWEASASLRKVQREYEDKEEERAWRSWDNRWSWDSGRSWQAETNSDRPVREDGKLDEAEQEDEEGTESWQNDWGSAWQGGWSEKTWKSTDYDPPSFLSS